MRVLDLVYRDRSEDVAKNRRAITQKSKSVRKSDNTSMPEQFRRVLTKRSVGGKGRPTDLRFWPQEVTYTPTFLDNATL
jgi:hypothetical protein